MFRTLFLNTYFLVNTWILHMRRTQVCDKSFLVKYFIIFCKYFDKICF